MKEKILLSGDTTELRARLQATQDFRIRVVDDLEKAGSIAEAMDFVSSIKKEADSVIVTIDDPIGNNSALIAELLKQGIRLVEFAEEEATLEDLYLDVIKGGAE